MPTKPPSHNALPKRKPWQHSPTRASRHARGYGTQWDKLRGAKLRDQPLCEYCLHHGRATPATEVDHYVPKAQGGTDDWDNLRSSCRACHAEKTAREAASAQGRSAQSKPGYRAGVDEDGFPTDPRHPWAKAPEIG